MADFFGLAPPSSSFGDEGEGQFYGIHTLRRKRDRERRKCCEGERVQGEWRTDGQRKLPRKKLRTKAARSKRRMFSGNLGKMEVNGARECRERG